jgi:hypothetical protein
LLSKNYFKYISRRTGTNTITDILQQSSFNRCSCLIDLGSTDNCNNIDLYTVTPKTIDCDDVNKEIDLTYTVTDNSNNVSLPHTVKATILDTRPPVASIENFNLVLKKTGVNIIYFDDFDAGGYDNCGLQTKGIYYDSHTIDDLCVAGTEDGAGEVAVLPRASIATITADHNPYSSSYPLSNVTDENYSSTAYMTELTNANTERTVYLSLAVINIISAKMKFYGISYHLPQNSVDLTQLQLEVMTFLAVIQPQTCLMIY